MRSRRGARRGCKPTYGDRVVDVFGFDYVAQEHRRLFLAWDAVVVFKYDTWRVDDPQATLELN
jgi:hypothetical protein